MFKPSLLYNHLNLSYVSQGPPADIPFQKSQPPPYSSPAPPVCAPALQQVHPLCMFTLPARPRSAAQAFLYPGPAGRTEGRIALVNPNEFVRPTAPGMFATP